MSAEQQVEQPTTDPADPAEVLLQTIAEMGKGLTVLRTEIRIYGRMSRLGLEQVTSTLDALGILLTYSDAAASEVLRRSRGES